MYKDLITTIKTRKHSNIDLPLVAIINGSGGNGKDSFVSRIAEISNRELFKQIIEDTPSNIVNIINKSSIDPVRRTTSKLLEHCGIDVSTINKDMEYRLLLQQIKSALDSYCDGSTMYLINAITGAAEDMANSDNNTPVTVFVHIREPENIDKLISCLSGEGYGYMTILVDGRTDPNSFTNESDRNVLNYDYDVTIHNDGTIEDLKGEAQQFYNALKEFFYAN